MSASASTKTTDSFAEQAAAWIVRLSADDEADRAIARAGFEAWKRADLRHADAAADMERLIGQLSRARDSGGGAPARKALQTAFRGQRRRRVRSAGVALLALCALLLPTWLALHSYPPGWLLADLRTNTGVWRTHTLEDGSRITLAGDSAVNWHFDGQRRALELVRGEVLVDVAHDASRPFVVDTAQGSIRALGTRFVVDRDGAVTELTMLQSRVAVRTAAQRALNQEATLVVDAGQRVRIGADSISSATAIDVRSVDDAWRYHQLVIADRPLAEVLDALNRQRPGLIRYDRAALDGIRVSAVLPLDDTDRALQLLLNNFPQLRIRTVTSYLVLVDAPLTR